MEGRWIALTIGKKRAAYTTSALAGLLKAKHSIGIGLIYLLQSASICFVITHSSTQNTTTENELLAELIEKNSRLGYFLIPPVVTMTEPHEEEIRHAGPRPPQNATPEMSIYFVVSCLIYLIEEAWRILIWWEIISLLPLEEALMAALIKVLNES